jgi:hypothetical protein
MEQYVEVTGRVASAVVCAAAFGEMLMPMLTARAMYGALPSLSVNTPGNHIQGRC